MAPHYGGMRWRKVRKCDGMVSSFSWGGTMRSIQAAMFAALLCAGSVHAQSAVQEKLKAVQADPTAARAAAEAGEKAAFFCVNCHGEGGNSKQPEVPTLAGQNPAYLLEQIRKFGAGERKNQFMEGMIKVLNEEQRIQIALHYAATPVVPKSFDATQAAKGKDVFVRHCVRCHGEKGLGNETIPRIAGQSAVYVETTVNRYRDKTGERNNALMSIATAALKKEEIPAVAHYLASMR